MQELGVVGRECPAVIVEVFHGAIDNLDGIAIQAVAILKVLNMV